MRAFVLFVLFLLAVSFALFTKGRVSLALFEKDLPMISFSEKPKAIGAIPKPFNMMIGDQGAGVDEVVVRVSQAGKTSTVFKKDYDENLHYVNESFLLNGKELNLREGEASLEVVVFDKSFWSNKLTGNYKVLVDYVRPQAEVLSVFHYGNQGGALSVVYRNRSSDIVRSGVVISGERNSEATEKIEIPGYPAALFDPQFRGSPDVYFSLFPIPQSFNPQKGRIEVFVEDRADNRTTITFPNKIQPRKFNEKDYNTFPREFFVKKVEELLPKYIIESKKSSHTVAGRESSDEEIISDFRTVNEEYRAFLDKKLLEITTNSEARKYWQGAFQRPLAAAPTASFGEIRRYFVQGKPAGGSIHNGVDLAQSANAMVRPANIGKVVMADDFGIYGNTIIIDHGFGLMTLYGHLAAILVREGEVVNTNTVIGRTGQTGLAGGDHLHFEVRLHGFPVTPIEWFDGKWISDKVEGQFETAREALQVRSR